MKKLKETELDKDFELSHTVTIKIYRGKGAVAMNPARELNVPYVADVKVEDLGVRDFGVKVGQTVVDMHLTDVVWDVEVSSNQDVETEIGSVPQTFSTGEFAIRLSGSFGKE